jgi:beta-phosphoglucomutase-like phosphatase (HAD superfamily)
MDRQKIATLLDFDGVLVDSELVHLAAFNDVLEKSELAISEKDYLERYISLDDAGVFRAVLSRGGRTLREDEVRAAVAAKAPRFMARFADSFRAFPGAPELVVRRAARGQVGIVSGALEAEIEFALQKMGVRAQVSFIVSAERPVAAKPDPAPFLLGLELLRRAGHAGPVVAVEDSIGGLTAAKRAGLHCAAVTHSHAREDLARSGADAIVDSLDELTDTVLEEGL